MITLLHGQSSYKAGLVPKINYNISISNIYSINLKAEPRLQIAQGNFSGDSHPNFKYSQSEFSLGISRKTGLNNKIAAGYLSKIKSNNLSHRLFQQFTMISQLSNLRLAHRIASDQSFSKNTFPELRLRYRITSEFPLNGETVDPGESYLKVNNEYLNSFQGINYDLEIRLSPVFGYVFTDKNKLEYGLDYRISSFLKNDSSHSLWIRLNWYIKS